MKLRELQLMISERESKERKFGAEPEAKCPLIKHLGACFQGKSLLYHIALNVTYCRQLETPAMKLNILLKHII